MIIGLAQIAVVHIAREASIFEEGGASLTEASAIFWVQGEGVGAGAAEVILGADLTVLNLSTVVAVILKVSESFSAYASLVN